MQVIKKEAINKEEALLKALEELNASTNEVICFSKEESGLLHSKYNVIVVTKYDVKEFIKNYLKNLAHLMNTKFDIEIKEIENGFNVLITTDDNAILIGRDGKNLNSIQILLRSALKKEINFDILINLDVAGYKVQKEKQLTKEIEKLAKEVIETKLDVKLDPTNSYDRRIVHNVISKYDNLVTESQGETPNRYVVIKYKKD